MRYDAKKAPPSAGEAKRNGLKEAVGLRWLAVMVCPVPGRLDGRMAQSTDEIRIRRMASECDDMSVPVSVVLPSHSRDSRAAASGKLALAPATGTRRY